MTVSEATVVATIFVVLSLIVGLLGWSFKLALATQRELGRLVEQLSHNDKRLTTVEAVVMQRLIPEPAPDPGPPQAWPHVRTTRTTTTEVDTSTSRETH